MQQTPNPGDKDYAVGETSQPVGHTRKQSGLGIGAILLLLALGGVCTVGVVIVAVAMLLVPRPFPEKPAARFELSEFNIELSPDSTGMGVSGSVRYRLVEGELDKFARFELVVSMKDGNRSVAFQEHRSGGDLLPEGEIDFRPDLYVKPALGPGREIYYEVVLKRREELRSKQVDVRQSVIYPVSNSLEGSFVLE